MATETIHHSIGDMLARHAEDRPDEQAIFGIARAPLTYSELATLIERVVRGLRDRGIARNDRVAIVLPNGPDMACTFLAVSSAATSAPLNPAYRADDFDFFLLGGDSLRAVEFIVRLSEAAASPLEPADLFRSPTVAEFARLLADPSTSRDLLVPLQHGDDGPPVFYVPGHGGDVFTFRELVGRLHPGRAAYACSFPPEAAADDDTAGRMLPVLAQRFVDAVAKQQPEGPYHLVGDCFGGELMAEMIALLEERGENTGTAVIIHSHLSNSSRRMSIARGLREEPLVTLRTIAGRAKGWVVRQRSTATSSKSSYTDPIPRRIDASVFLVRPTGELRAGRDYDPLMGWGAVTAHVEVHDIDGDGVSIFTEPIVDELTELLRPPLAQ